MSDVCMCEHEEREHVISDAARYGVSTSDVCDRCACHTYRRSPLSAFRGPRVTFTREEAAGWLDALEMPYSRWVALNGDARVVSQRVRDLARDGRTNERIGWVKDAQCCYLAARILRAVRA